MRKQWRGTAPGVLCAQQQNSYRPPLHSGCRCTHIILINVLVLLVSRSRQERAVCVVVALTGWVHCSTVCCCSNKSSLLTVCLNCSAASQDIKFKRQRLYTGTVLSAAEAATPRCTRHADQKPWRTSLQEVCVFFCVWRVLCHAVNCMLTACGGGERF